MKIETLSCQFCLENFNDQSILEDHIHQSHYSGQAIIKYEQHLDYDQSFDNANEVYLPETIVQNQSYEDLNYKINVDVFVEKEWDPKTNKKPFVCVICHKSFAYKKFLQNHRKTHNIIKENKRCFKKDKNEKKQYQCKVCSQCFSHTSSLYRHIKLHADENAYKCSLCPQAFRIATSLRLHEEKHALQVVKEEEQQQYHQNYDDLSNSEPVIPFKDGKKGFNCDICNKMFTKKFALTNHQRLHIIERPYQCKTCGKSFPHTSSLYRHNKVHMDARPFKCKFCNMTFKNSDNFKKHEERHLIEKPYECGYCDKFFVSVAKLNSHEQGHIKRSRSKRSNFEESKRPIEVLEESLEHDQGIVQAENESVRHLNGSKHADYFETLQNDDTNDMIEQSLDQVIDVPKSEPFETEFCSEVGEEYLEPLKDNPGNEVFAYSNEKEDEIFEYHQNYKSEASEVAENLEDEASDTNNYQIDDMIEYDILNQERSQNYESLKLELLNETSIEKCDLIEFPEERKVDIKRNSRSDEDCDYEAYEIDSDFSQG